ncbi:GNAT family N-acetyltransferase [Corynebacterium heidelbergense]|uniref:N-acetyltransferase n=1 Tax=Corynebacterium heidelbergense TaxID=2055947 RepID=A0A364V821_9CORY|nr:GNAT family N-acetyltransferase [Corynebacterium heidelbergense]RAV32771.1 N-acetyltransferase [Corynebacterium heidelbergense]
MEVSRTESSYVLDVEGQRAGFADFLDRGEVRDFNHTVVFPEFRGRGLSAPLIEGALEDTRRAGLKVRPTCSAVARFIERNPEYQDLVVQEG